MTCGSTSTPKRRVPLTSYMGALDAIRRNASQAEAAYVLMSLSIKMGLCAIVLSLARRQPISVAW